MYIKSRCWPKREHNENCKLKYVMQNVQLRTVVNLHGHGSCQTYNSVTEAALKVK